METRRGPSQAIETQRAAASEPSPPVALKPHHPGLSVRLFVVVLLVTAAAVYAVFRLGFGRPAEMPLTGTLEVNEIDIAAEAPGRVVAVTADEGDPVYRGELLVRLDDSLLQTQYRQADPTQRQLLDIEIERTRLRSPIDGVVVRRTVDPGEVAGAGIRLMTVADLSTLDLTLYVHERDLPRIRVGQRVLLTTDAYPGRAFEAAVASIAASAEFTPRNIQTKQDRVNLVFPVRVRVPNPNGDLRPGVPVDATLG